MIYNTVPSIHLHGPFTYCYEIFPGPKKFLCNCLPSDFDRWLIYGVNITIRSPPAAQTKMCERRNTKQSVRTPTSSSPLFPLSPSVHCLSLSAEIRRGVWRTSQTGCCMFWQPPVTVVRQKLDLRPLPVSNRDVAPRGVKKHFLFSQASSLSPAWCCWRVCRLNTKHSLIGF